MPRDEWKDRRPRRIGYEQRRAERRYSAMAGRFLAKAEGERKRRKRKRHEPARPPDTRPARERAADLEGQHLRALAEVADAKRARNAAQELVNIGVLPLRPRELRAARARVRKAGRALRRIAAEWDLVRSQAAAEEIAATRQAAPARS